MSDAKLLSAGIDAPDAEVELSAEDLIGLSGPDIEKHRAQESQPRTKIVSIESSKPAPPQKSAAPTPRRAMSFVRIAAAIVVGVLAASYFVVRFNHSAGDSIAKERAPQSQLPASTSRSEGKPVLFANPFDANEVFEFPAGTSEAEARDAVAEILMERAMERQSKFDARVSSNR
jgi:hypothetical protein